MTKINRSQNILGRWLCVTDLSGDHYRVGQVTQRVGEFHWIVRFRPFTRDVPAVSEVLGIDSLEDQMIFDSERQLDAWLAWAEKDEERGPKVVVLRGDK